jgi:deoxycytidine triphosphate deaminase
MPTLSEKRQAQGEFLHSLRPSEDDPHPEIHGVLLSDEIIFYSEAYNLIQPFNRNNLKPAGYELTIGDEYFLSGSFFELDSDDDTKRTITIPPFDVAILKTAEILCMPRYLIARWNIRVKYAYAGLLWVGGPQVDPGYVGHLFCPIYNLSDKPVTLPMGEPIALIDFVKTTPFEESKPKAELKRYAFPPKRMFLEEYGINDLRSALFTKAGQKLTEFEQQIKNLENRFFTFTQLSFAIFGLLIALSALLTRTNADNATLSAAFFGGGTIALSATAILIAAFAYFRGRFERLIYEQYGLLLGERAISFMRQSWWLGTVIALVFFCATLTVVYLGIEPAFRDLRQQHVLTKSDLDASQKSTAAEISGLIQRLDHVEQRETDISVDLLRLAHEVGQKVPSGSPEKH